MMKKHELGWALVDVVTGRLMLLDGHMPVFWRHSVAERKAKAAGLTTHGRTQDVRICRVMIAQYSGTRR